MILRSRWSQAIFSAFWVVLIVAAWIAFAPTPAGGMSSYILIIGNSMEPNFHRGDLIIVHPASEYNVGDIIAYRNIELKSNVFHRIIEQEYGRYTLKGDNNSWLDSYQPSREEVIGKLWIHLPRVGSMIQFLRTPLNMALFAAALIGVLAFTIFATRSKDSRLMTKKPMKDSVADLLRKFNLQKERDRTAAFSDLQVASGKSGLSRLSVDPIKDQPPANFGNILEGLFFALGFIAFVSLILGIISFTRPAFISVPDDVNYQHIGLFSYSAAAPSSVYDSGTLQTGEPIFPNLTCSIDLNFQYYLAGDSIENIAGNYSITAQIIEPQTGWKRSIPLQVDSAFSGNTFDSRNELDLCKVTALIKSMETETEFHPGQYNLLITPQISVTGRIGGRELQDTYESRLMFRYDRVNFSVVSMDPESDPFSQSEPNFIREMRNRANTIPLFGAEPSVPSLRVIALVGLALSLAGIWAVWMYIQSIKQRNPDAVIQMKYNAMVVDIQSNGFKPASQAVEVLSMEDLAKLAEHNNAMILHETQGRLHNYLVQTDGFAYLYSKTETETQALSESLVHLSNDLRRGIEHGEFQVHYQPIVSLIDGKITAVEALLRWQHPEKGLISAAEFIPAAKTTGLIQELDEWMLRAACTQLKGWQESGIDLKLAVNLSNHNIQSNPTHFIRRLLETTGVKPQSLQIEISETDVLENSPALLPQMRELKELGINIAMDDFIGESAISSFGQYPINSIKIDRMIVKKLNNPKEAVSVQQMIMVARNLGLEVAAIGVETDEQKGLLNVHSCSQAQGYLLGRPMPAQNIVQMVRERNVSSGQTSPEKRTASRKAKE
jgi:signal peptidase I